MTAHIQHVEIILYVSNPKRSSDFYQNLLRKTPDLEVPGMTEFIISDTCKVGLMPNSGIAKILKDKMPSPDSGNGIPRCELYLLVEDIEQEYENAISIGAKLLRPIQDMDWGDRVCYFADPDGHIIAFAHRR